MLSLVSEFLLSLRDRSQKSAETLARTALVCDKPVWHVKWEHLPCHQWWRQQQKVLLCCSLSYTGTPFTEPKAKLLFPGTSPRDGQCYGKWGLIKEFVKLQCFIHEGFKAQRKASPHEESHCRWWSQQWTWHLQTSAWSSFCCNKLLI